jgi:colicin import membrane protein
MDHRPLTLLGRLIMLLAISFAALANDAGPSPEQLADWQQRLDQAVALQAEASAQRLAADKVLDEKNLACAKKFLVNACRDKARTEHLEVAKAARRLENEAKALEREVKKEQFADKEARRAAQAPQHEADLADRQRETEALRQEAESREATTRADKARKAEEGAKRKAAEAEKQRQKAEDHARKIREAEQRTTGSGK